MSYSGSPALHAKPKLIRVPLFAQIAAGNPFQDCFQIGWRWIHPPRNYRPGHELCAVQINGDSLIGSAIVNGDVAICRLTPELERNGQLAAVLIGDGLTLKYVHVETNGGVWLRAANPLFPDRFFLPGEATIQAIVMMIERDL